MKVYIARDGVEIGECEREELEPLLREGQLEATDYYWHEGMENWLLVGEAGESREPESVAAIEVEPEIETPITPVPLPAKEATVIETPVPSPSTADSIAADLLPKPEPFRGSTSRGQGMRLSIPDWFRLPIQKRFRLPVLGAVAAILLAIVGYSVMSARSDRAARAGALFPPSEGKAPTLPPTPDEVRDTASAVLRAKIERLPAQPVPPLHTFYYGVTVNMRRLVDPRVPWMAIIRGKENTVDPATEKTTVHTDFVLTVEYRDGEWVFQKYHASASDMLKEETAELDANADTLAPPSIVTMMGLKLPRS